MENQGIKNNPATLESLGVKQVKAAFWNLSPEELIAKTIQLGQGTLADNGALAIETGEFTGRSPEDRFIVKDDITTNQVNWNAINQPFPAERYDVLYPKVLRYLEDKEVYVRDAYACADKTYRLSIRVVTEHPWSNLFAYNMFLRPTEAELSNFDPEWSIICVPNFRANPIEDGTRRHNFSIINFGKKQILIGGSGYTGEIKKGIFSVLNFLLPVQHHVLPMHCSANVGEAEDTAIFFGLSGTGKTTLSADPNRFLIGDDEHGWSQEGVFNFEGGCYAKVIDLTEEKEPEIYRAIREGAILENVKFYPGTNTPDYSSSEITENTRVSYPIDFIPNALQPSLGDHPKNIFFLTCDAFGVLPPISKLTTAQAMYHFISGYTAKVAGTETGITEPQVTFSACFGAPFMPLHPTQYAEMLGEQMRRHKVNVWLVNTGWTGGPYGTGNRIRLNYTRAMITAALNGSLLKFPFQTHEVFSLEMPTFCPNVPTELLNPRQTWEDKAAYDEKAHKLAAAFHKNFAKYADRANDEILEGAPMSLEEV